MASNSTPFCRHCGRKLSPEILNYCTYCGGSIRDASLPQTQLESSASRPKPQLSFKLGMIASVFLFAFEVAALRYSIFFALFDPILLAIVVLPYFVLPFVISAYSHWRYHKGADQKANFIGGEFVALVAFSVVFLLYFPSYVYFAISLVILGIIGLVALKMTSGLIFSHSMSQSADSVSYSSRIEDTVSTTKPSLIQELSPLIAILGVIVTGVPLAYVAFQNGSAYLSPFDEALTNFFMFAYFPMISILSPLCYWGFSKIKYKNSRGLVAYTVATAILSFLLVGAFWLWAFMGAIATSGGQ
jgi:hypothetical protein